MDARYNCPNKDNKDDNYTIECPVKIEPRQVPVFEEDEFQDIGPAKTLLDNVAQIKQEFDRDAEQEKGPNISQGVKVPDDDMLLVSLKVETPDEHDQKEGIPATIKEEEMFIEHNLNVKSSFVTKNEYTVGTLYSQSVVSNFKTLKRIKSERSEETPDLGKKAATTSLHISATYGGSSHPAGQTVDSQRTPGDHFHKDQTSLYPMKTISDADSGIEDLIMFCFCDNNRLDCEKCMMFFEPPDLVEVIVISDSERE